MRSVLKLLPLVALAVAQSPAAQIPLDPTAVLDQQPLTLDSIPLLGFGTWNLQKSSNASDAVSWAIQTGYRHIDCAAIYGNEKEVGRGIYDGLQKAGLTRSDIWVTSKLWNDHHDPNAVESALTKTLHDLGLEYLDLYHMHWPVASTSFGNKIDYLDTYGAMTLLLEKGKVRHIGISNFDPEQLKDLLNHTAHPPSVHQMEMHPYLQQNDWLDFHERNDIHVTAYSPLAGSNPTYAKGDPPQLLNNGVVEHIAEKRGCTPAQVALAWGMSRGVSVIPKSQHAERITENFHSLECKLEKSDYKALSKLGKKYTHRYNNPSKGWGVDLYKGLEGT